MSAVLAITLGNSSAAAALAQDDALGQIRRAGIERLDDLGGVLARACPDCGGEATPIAVASVNPPALKRLERLLADMSLPAPLVARRDFPIPIRTEVDVPERVGVDRLLGALAAYRRLGGACVVVDFGTAITVNSVRADGVFLGGAILPGLGLAARALAEGTALLPEIPLPGKANPVGRNTEEAIAAGVIHGAAGAAANLIRGARQVIGAEARVILTGGDAVRVVDHLPPDCRQVLPDLVLEGLVIAYRERPKP